MEAFHLLRPWWLIALVPWLGLCWRLWRGAADRRAWRAVCDPALLPFVVEGASPPGRRRWAAALALGGTLAILALAGPAWRELPQPVYRQDEALVIALDLSRSMDAADLEPSRLARARLKVRELLRRRVDGQTALVVYAGDAFAVTPLTDDVNTIDALVPGLDTEMMPVQGTRTDRALDLAAALLERAGVRHGRVLLITDGAGSAAAAAAAAGLGREGHRLSVIGVGTPEGSTVPAGADAVVRDASGQAVVTRLQDAALRALAEAGGGRYARLSTDDRDLDAVLSRGWLEWHSVTDVPGLSSDRWREEGPWLLLALLPLASIVFRRGLLLVALALALPAPRPAAALEWGAPWLNPDQRGHQALEARDYPRAAALFRDPQWKAAALYRAGRFQEAAEALAPLRHPRALYNRGNALARLGRRDEAMALYEQVLEADPDHADARYNLELLRALEPSPSPPGGGGGEDQASRPPPEPPREPPPGGGRDGGSPREGGDASTRGGTSPAPPEGGASDRAPDTPPPGDEAQAGAADTDEAQTADSPREPPRPASSGDDLSPSEQASRQALRQWLRQIEDDPAGLLRRKFRYQYTRRPAPGPADMEPW